MGRKNHRAVLYSKYNVMYYIMSFTSTSSTLTLTNTVQMDETTLMYYNNLCLLQQELVEKVEELNCVYKLYLSGHITKQLLYNLQSTIIYPQVLTLHR